MTSKTWEWTAVGEVADLDVIASGHRATIFLTSSDHSLAVELDSAQVWTLIKGLQATVDRPEADEGAGA